MLEIEKKESKTLNTFQKLLEQINQSPQYNQNRQGQSNRENVLEETTKNQLASETFRNLAPYINNSSEETSYIWK